MTIATLPQFNEDRLLCDVPANDKIDSSALPPIGINYTRIIVITLEMFLFRIITDVNCILNVLLPISSKLLITCYDLFNVPITIVSVNTPIYFVNYSLEKQIILAKNKQDIFVCRVGNSWDHNNQLVTCFQTNNILGRELFVNRLQHQRTMRRVLWDDVLINKHQLCIIE